MNTETYFEGGYRPDISRPPLPSSQIYEGSINKNKKKRSVETEKQSPDRGIFIQENDRVAAAQRRKENLTEKEFVERAESIKKLRLALLGWIKENVPDNNWDQSKLKAMTDYISKEHSETVNEITKNFLNREMYPQRPVVKLMLREISSLPDVCIFGWRGKDDKQWDRETKIHDHADSSGALTVHEGAVDETVYVVDASNLKTVGTMGPDNPRGSQRIKLLDQKTKTYRSGVSKTFKSPPPYLHTVAGSPEYDLTVTIHAYLRPSDEVAYDFALDAEKGELYEIGVS